MTDRPPRTEPPRGLTREQADALGAFATDPVVSGTASLRPLDTKLTTEFEAYVTGTAVRPPSWAPAAVVRLATEVRRLERAAQERERQTQADLAALRQALQASQDQSRREHGRTQSAVHEMSASLREEISEAEARTERVLRGFDARRADVETFLATFAKTVEQRQTKVLAAASLLSPRGLIALFLTMVLARHIDTVLALLLALFRPHGAGP